MKAGLFQATVTTESHRSVWFTLKAGLFQAAVTTESYRPVWFTVKAGLFQAAVTTESHRPVWFTVKAGLFQAAVTTESSACLVYTESWTVSGHCYYSLNFGDFGRKGCGRHYSNDHSLVINWSILLKFVFLERQYHKDSKSAIISCILVLLTVVIF